MTAEEKLIIEQLLADCSPTVQSIINVHNQFTIPPPCEEEDDNREELGSDDEVVPFDTWGDDDGDNILMDNQLNATSVSYLVFL